jgi:hypothetical protein
MFAGPFRGAMSKKCFCRDASAVRLETFRHLVGFTQEKRLMMDCAIPRKGSICPVLDVRVVKVRNIAG